MSSKPMSRKDYVLLGQVIARTRNSLLREKATPGMTVQALVDHTTDTLIENLCVALKRDNRLFNPDLFRQACYAAKVEDAFNVDRPPRVNQR